MEILFFFSCDFDRLEIDIFNHGAFSYLFRVLVKCIIHKLEGKKFVILRIQDMT